MAVVGPKEAQSNTVHVRVRGGQDGKAMALDAFASLLQRTIASKQTDPVTS